MILKESYWCETEERKDKVPVSNHHKSKEEGVGGKIISGEN